MHELSRLIRDINDFPKKGIIFKDITPLLGDPQGLRQSVQELAADFTDVGVTKVVGAEARGFIFGTAVALELGAGFVPVRKPGKLPYETRSVTYDLEYGTDTVEMHTDAVGPDDKVLMVDDLLATGGTMAACCKMVEEAGATIVGVTFLVELAFLNGRDKLPGYDIRSKIVVD
jgi:adenine phosphoribosyltransferase